MCAVQRASQRSIGRSIECTVSEPEPAIPANLATLRLEPLHGPGEHEGCEVRGGFSQTINKNWPGLDGHEEHPVMDPKPTGLNLSLNICNNPEGYTDQQQASTPEIYQLQLHHLPPSRHFPCLPPYQQPLEEIEEEEGGGVLHGASRGHLVPKAINKRQEIADDG